MRPPGFSELAAGAALAVLGGALLADAVHVSHDVALLLEVGERLLSGQRPYVDYVETNPPLAHYLHAGVVLAGRAVGLGPVPAMWAVAYGALLAAVVALGMGGRPVWGDRGAARAAAGFAGAALFAAAVGNFAQRDHLFAMFVAPWVVHRLRVRAGSGAAGWGALAGALGAVGVCIKPHFLLVAAVLEAWVFAGARRRALEPGLAVFCATGLLYPAHFALWPDAVRDAFFGVWLPAVAAGYRVYGDPWAAYPTLAPVWGAAALGVGLGLAPRERGLGLVGLAAWVVYFLQWKGWFYHLIPALSFGAAAAAVAVGPWARDTRGLAIRLLGGSAVAIVALLLVRGNAVPDGGAARAAFEARMRPGERALVLSTELSPAYPWLPRLGVERTGTYPVAFPLAVLWPDGHAGPFGEASSPAEVAFRSDLATDLRAGPDWVLVDAHEPCPHCGPGVSFPRYLSEIGLYAEIGRSYERAEVADGLELWRRADWRRAIDAWRHPEPLPDLPLIDQDGRAFRTSDLRGAHVLVGFVFTRCGVETACPLTMQRLAAVRAARTAEDPPLRILALTLDPAYDTPERLAAYAERFGLPTGPDTRLATGPEGLLGHALPALFNVLSLPGPGGLEHTVKLALLDPELRLVEQWTDDAFSLDALEGAVAR